MHRIHSLDYLKLGLAVLVAFAHTYWLQTNMTPRLFMIGNGLMRVMVPTFCIAAGYFLYSAVARGKGVKWLWRVLALYLFWMAVYFPFWLDQIHGVASLIKELVWGYFHLWFMAGILVAGALVLILRALGRALAPAYEYRILLGTAAVCALIGVTLQYMALSGVAQIGVKKFLNGVFMCFPFVTIGYLCGRRVARLGIEGLPPRWLVLSLTIGGFGLLMIEAWLVQARWTDAVMLDIPASSYVAAPALFIVTLGTRLPAPPIRLDPISAGIYFMHVLALHLAHALGFTHLLDLMLFAVGLPTLVALLLQRLPIPGFGKPEHRHHEHRHDTAQP
ncbi:Surface polysaccharide O-acyltransferase, integral membrane enzyme [Paracoccus aminovorans]|uniref:Surface polysaccharide O-acyltransferase, integral membrane enzyme n=1 Tax=Paracoccus aminovorans TaxID=34004 RepID=A0A1I3C491_9RHOB|nr:acyltransferase family protein [Paracoccus aminovorans]CQR86439.1 acyltransferase family protein [Paracoccus aminovorans]SFH69146.1 Surface polysaccharide O-acyltransferase, integral membrane enzyme [Paracoccus aminovorans]